MSNINIAKIITKADKRDTLVAWVLKRLGEAHDEILRSHGATPDAKKQAKLTKAVRREAKGIATTKEIKLLDDNDILDSWFDSMEAERDIGEEWVENPSRTQQELEDFDPGTLNWPVYPLEA